MIGEVGDRPVPTWREAAVAFPRAACRNGHREVSCTMQKTLRRFVDSRFRGSDASHAGRHDASIPRKRDSGRSGPACAASGVNGMRVRTGGIFRNLVLALTLVAVGGCGYQLRGAASLPSDLAAIHVAGPRDVSHALVLLLEGGGISVAPGRDSASSVVKLSGEQFHRRVLSVDSDTGKQREFELVYRIEFEVTGASGEELLAKQTVTLLRDYIFDPNAVLGKSREQAMLHAEMRRDAAAQIVRRISASLGRRS